MNTDLAWVRNLLSNALNMLNKNLTGFAQSLFSVQSICTVREGSASRVTTSKQLTISIFAQRTFQSSLYRDIEDFGRRSTSVTPRFHFSNCSVVFNISIGRHL